MTKPVGTLEGETLTIAIGGHIDSTNAEEFESGINAIIGSKKFTSLVLDAQTLEYISSAGLRVILRLSQTNANFKIINVSSSVYEVLDMTGFTEMIKVEKAYRVLSIEGCEVIGQGANGKVYRLDPDTIIKVYFNKDALPEIQRERELARKAFVLGIPTAIPYDVVKVGDSYGSVFELLNARSFSKLLAEDPSTESDLVQRSVDLLKKIHSTVVQPTDMPSIKLAGIGWADYLKDYLPLDQYAKLHQLIASIPERNTMIHGDFHTKNIMMQKGEVLLIDMDTLSYGHPIFEISSMYLAYIGFNELHHEEALSFLGIPFEIAQSFFYQSMALYLGTEDQKAIQDVVEKAEVIGYCRMMRRTIKRIGKDTPEGKPLVELCAKHLADLLPRIDSLDF